MTKLNNRFLAVALLASTAMRMPATFEGENQGFAFPDEVDSLDAVPERARGLYEKEGEKFKFKDVGALRNGLQNARNERDAARRDAASAAAYKALGKTPEEIQSLLAADAEREQTRLTEEGNWTALREQMEGNHATALGEKDKRIGSLEKALKQNLIDNGLQTALAMDDVGGNPLLLLPHMRGRVELQEENGDFRAVVVREDGTPLLNTDNRPATLKDLALEFKAKPEFASAFKGLNNSGGGAQGGGSGGGGGAPAGSKSRSKMTTGEKVAYIKEHGLKGYESLPEN